MTFLGFRKPLYSCTEGMCYSSTHPGMSYHVTQFYQAFPRISTASNKRWAEKAWVRGYIFSNLANSLLTLHTLCLRESSITHCSGALTSLGLVKSISIALVRHHSQVCMKVVHVTKQAPPFKHLTQLFMHAHTHSWRNLNVLIQSFMYSIQLPLHTVGWPYSI